MDTEDLVIDDRCQGQVVKNSCAVPPNVDGSVLSETLVVESIDLGNLSAFVVASYQSDSFRVSDFESDQK